MKRVRAVSKSRVFRMPVYEVEDRAEVIGEWVSLGRFGGRAVSRLLDREPIHPTDVTLMLQWAWDAHRDGDHRWIYPDWGAQDSPPEEI